MVSGDEPRLEQCLLPADRRQVRLRNLGRTHYEAVLALQRRVLAERLRGGADTLLVTEHEPVITTGRGADFRHVLAASTTLARLGVALVRSERGGDVTLHLPGQLVAYPVIGLSGENRDLHRYVYRLEEVARRLLAGLGVAAERRAGAPGLYVDGNKIASIGVFVRHWVTMHGFSVNLAPDPQLLGLIRPCGMEGVAFTSLAALTGTAPTVADAVESLAASFAEVFDCELDR